MGDDADLTDFGLFAVEDIPPLVYRRGVVWSPTARGKPAGFIGYDRRREYKVYTTRRKPYHYYREGDGYAISDDILDTLKHANVPRIIAWEAGSGDAYEFLARMYHENGREVPERELLDEADPQTYVPLDDHLHHWGAVGDDLHVEDFDTAMGRLSAKSGW